SPRLHSSVFTPPAPTHLYTLSLHDALPIYHGRVAVAHASRGGASGADSRCGPRARRSTGEASSDGRGDEASASRRHADARHADQDRKSTRLNSSHVSISYAVFCLKKKKRTR